MKFSIFSVLFFLHSFYCSGVLGAAEELTPARAAAAALPQATASIGQDHLEFLSNDPDLSPPYGLKECSRKIEKMLEGTFKLLENGYTGPIKLDIAVFSINDWELLIHPRTHRGRLADILAEARRNSGSSVKVRLLTDAEQSRSRWSESVLQALQRFCPDPHILEIRILGTINASLENLQSMHLKTAIVETEGTTQMIMGSYNWTNASRNKNYENCIYLQSNLQDGLRSPVQKAQRQFEMLWEKARLYAAAGSPPPPAAAATPLFTPSAPGTLRPRRFSEPSSLPTSPALFLAAAAPRPRPPFVPRVPASPTAFQQLPSSSSSSHPTFPFSRSMMPPPRVPIARQVSADPVLQPVRPVTSPYFARPPSAPPVGFSPPPRPPTPYKRKASPTADEHQPPSPHDPESPSSPHSPPPAPDETETP